MGREELRAALEELTASMSLGLLDADDIDLSDGAASASEERLARLELLEELRGL